MSNGAEVRIARSSKKILAAAERAFLEKGFLATTMDEVAEAAGVSKQTVYARFGSKEALFVRVVEAMTGAANEQMEPLTNVPAGEFLLDFALQDLAIVLTPKLMQLRRMVIGEAARFPEFGKALFENGPAASIRWLAKALKAYAAKGELVVRDPAAAAVYFNWLVMGAPVNNAMFLGDASFPSKTAQRKHAAECVRIFLAAFTPPPPSGSPPPAPPHDR